MPKMVTLIPNPAYAGKDAASKAAYEAAKAKGAITVDYPTALENVKLSGGLYTMQDDSSAAPVTAARELEDMPDDELKLMMLQSGIAPEKQMKRSQIIAAIREKLSEIEVVDE